LTRLGDSWPDVADAFNIKKHERDAFPLGQEPRKVYDWLESRGRLADLPAALLEVGRRDLADVLDNDQFEPSVPEKLRWVRAVAQTGTKGLGTKVQVLHQWVLVRCPDPLQVPVTDYPKVEFLIYSGTPADAPGGAEFYVTAPSATTSYT
jgi:hypothetical protein